LVRQLAQAVDPEGHLGRQVQQVRHLLQAGCLGKAAAGAVVVTLALAVQAAQEAEALVVAAVAQHAVHTPLALVVSVAMAGHWFWSFDHAAICSC
jgi:hypothetical protein